MSAQFLDQPLALGFKEDPKRAANCQPEPPGRGSRGAIVDQNEIGCHVKSQENRSRLAGTQISRQSADERSVGFSIPNYQPFGFGDACGSGKRVSSVHGLLKDRSRDENRIEDLRQQVQQPQP